MSKRLVSILCIIILGVGTAALMAERPKPAEKLALEGPENPPANTSNGVTRPVEAPYSTQTKDLGEALGTITYDDGIVTHFPGASSNCFGNQFDTANGAPVMASGSVTAMQFFMVPGTGSDNVFISVFGPVSGTSASVLTSVSVPSSSNAWNTHTFATAVSYTGPSFLAGMWYIAGDTVGLGTGTVGTQGHHGMFINDIIGTGFATLSGLNALVRAGGDVLIPVELMTFSVE